jgi:hypothetical protein
MKGTLHQQKEEKEEGWIIPTVRFQPQHHPHRIEIPFSFGPETMTLPKRTTMTLPKRTTRPLPIFSKEKLLYTDMVSQHNLNNIIVIMERKRQETRMMFVTMKLRLPASRMTKN